MLGKKTVFWIVLFSTLSLRAGELEGLSVARIQRQEEKILNFQRKINRLKKAGYVVAAAGLTVGALLLYKHYQTPQKEGNTEKKDASSESNAKQLELEKIRLERAKVERDAENKRQDNLILEKVIKREKRTLWEIIQEDFYLYVGVGALLTLGSVVYKFLAKTGTSSFKWFSQLFKNRTDDISIFGRQILSNCDNLDLFLQNYVDPDGTESDRVRHRSQIIEGHNILIRCIENLIAALAIKARQSDNDPQARWLLSKDNRIFKGVLRLNKALEAKLAEDANNPEFCNLSLIREALEQLLKSVDVVAQNCEAQYHETIA